MASAAPVLSNEIDVERTLATSRDGNASELTLADFDIEGTAEHICRGFRRVALQFPDELLHHAESIVAALTDAVRQRRTDTPASPPPELFVLADTSFDGFQVDFVAAQHLEADMLVHYGPADLQAQGPMAVRFVFGRRHIDARALTAAFADAFAPTRRVLLVFALAYEHASSEVAQALGVSHPEAMVCVAEIEQPAAEDSSNGGGGSVDGVASTEAAARCDAATGEANSGGGGGSGGTSGDSASGGGGGGERTLLGRRLPRPLSQAELAECALVYVGEEDATLANLCVLLSQSDVFIYSPPQQLAAADSGTAAAMQRLMLPTAKRMMRRYYLVQQAREAAVVGLLVGSLSVSQRRPVRRDTRRSSNTTPSPPLPLACKSTWSVSLRLTPPMPYRPATRDHRRCWRRCASCAAAPAASTTSSSWASSTPRSSQTLRRCAWRVEGRSGPRRGHSVPSLGSRLGLSSGLLALAPLAPLAPLPPLPPLAPLPPLPPLAPLPPLSPLFRWACMCCWGRRSTRCLRAATSTALS